MVILGRGRGKGEGMNILVFSSARLICFKSRHNFKDVIRAELNIRTFTRPSQISLLASPLHLKQIENEEKT